jgi:hypothetical protein
MKDDLQVCIEAAVATHERPMELGLASRGGHGVLLFEAVQREPKPCWTD